MSSRAPRPPTRGPCHSFYRASRASIQATARKIGYQRADRFFPAPTGDTAALVLIMTRAVQTVDAVKITAAEDVKRKSYHADADDIANSTRPIFDGMDVITKLRPDMLKGRSGQCPIAEVWVNGSRIRLAPENTMGLARRGIGPPDPTPVKAGQSQMNARRALPNGAVWSATENVVSVLSSIKPEHIAEINYADCFDMSVNAVGAQQAAFVILKPGVSYDPSIGSFVDETHGALPSALPIALPTTSTASLAYRRRVLGVYDWMTGDPIPGADVVNVETGTFATTTGTGTVSLAFLPDGTSHIRVRRPGFNDLTLEVAISPSDTSAITLVMTRPK